MWRVRGLETTTIELDFRSSGQGRRSDTSLLADGCRLVNAANLVDFDPASDHVQVEVCEDCGISRCAPGGWVALRRLGTDVLWLPAFEAMSADRGTTEYAPPSYTRQHGLPVFGESVYAAVRQRVRALPAPSDIRPLAWREVALALQWEAPGRVLGDFPDPPTLRHDTVRAVAIGDVAELVARVGEMLRQAWVATDLPVQLEAAEMVAMYLALPRHPMWAPLARSGETWGINLGEGLVVALANVSA